MVDWANFAGWRRNVLHGLCGTAAILWCLIAPRAAVAQQGAAFFKAGPAFALNNAFYENTNLGWSTAGGYRQPFAGRGAAGFVFIDLGGSYLSITGEGNTEDVPGAFVVTDAFGASTSTPVANLVDVTVRDLRRASVDTAIGWQATPGGPGGGLGAMFRFGGRFGHLHARVNEVTTATTNALIAGVPAGSTFTLLKNYSKTDTFGGLFCGGGVTLTNRSFQTLALGRIGVAVGAEFEYSYDWIDLGNLEDAGLAAGAALFSIEFFR